MTITFDSVDITTAPYVPRFIKHETVPERILSLMSLAREDGSVIIAEKYGVKHILLQGIIYGSTQSDLETKIDIFKELFSREAKDLDISWEAGTRRYVATCVSHKFNRDYFNISMCPWTVDFIVPEGVGKDTNLVTTEIVMEDSKDQEWESENRDTGLLFGKETYFGQGFTPGVGITNISLFKAYLIKSSGDTVIYCDIYAVDGDHKPTGGTLGQTSIPAITNIDDYEWKTFEFAAPIALTPGTDYVAVLSSPDYSGIDAYAWGKDSDGGYDGYETATDDAGTSWSAGRKISTYIFETWHVYLPYTGILTFEGSAEPRPVILLTVDSGWTNAYGMSFENTDTGERIVINTGITAIGDGDKFEIDCANKTVRWYHSGEWRDMEFRGVFPHFVVGENNYKIEAGDIIDQQFTIESVPTYSVAIYTGQTHYQSFTIPQEQKDYQGMSLRLNKKGTPPNNLIITILNDLNGSPDAASPVANATFEVEPGDATTSLAWIFKNSTSRFTLEANKTYWIRMAMADGDSDNHFVAQYNPYGNYPRGVADMGGDFLFKLYYTGKVDTSPVQILDVDYYKRYL